MRNVLSKKLKNKKGFTLAELLIVVAIIAILVAIMIPVFGGARANAIQAKDLANVRAAYAEAVLEKMASSSYTPGSTMSIEIDKSDLNLESEVEFVTSTHTVKVTTSGASPTEKSFEVDSEVTVTFVE